MNKIQRKKLISMRFSPSILFEIDAVRQETDMQSRTEFIETACSLYAEYLREILKEKLLDEIY